MEIRGPSAGAWDAPGGGDAVPVIQEGETSRAEKRRQTLAAKKAKREADRARRDARKAAADAAQEPEALAPPEVIDETQLARQLGKLLGIAWRIARLVVGWFGFEVELLSDAKKAEHAEHWMPLALAHRWMRVVCAFTAPLLILEDFIAGMKRKGADGGKGKQVA